MEMMNTDPDGSMPTDATHAAAADPRTSTALMTASEPTSDSSA